MRFSNEIIQGYENTELKHYGQLLANSPQLVPYSDLASREITGALKACFRIDNDLYLMFSNGDMHVAVVATTGGGKTTQYVFPTILAFAHAHTKRSLVISDPKGEAYRTTAITLRNEGYDVLLVNYRDFLYSECFNPLTHIFDKYMRVHNLEDEVDVVETANGFRNKFMGVIYESQRELDKAVARMKKLLEEDVANDIDTIATIYVAIENSRDPYWHEAARDLLKACIWAMLEDIDPQQEGVEPITRDTFSFRTMLSIMDNLVDDDGDHYRDGGYFSDRPANSRAYMFAKNTILENGRPTRKCIVSMLNTALSVFKTSTIKLLTSCNSFDLDVLTNSNRPVAIFIDYKDEDRTHYKVISAFIQSVYMHLIQYANSQPTGKLNIPFYFILDEFGNFPIINDFDTVISAARGRNIYFILVLQSWAQLENIYGRNTAEIIKDNLNLHIFIGSNNPPTIEAFSRECGLTTRFSPTSALSGRGGEIENYQIETIPLVPQSNLTKLQVGEAIVTEAKCGYVMLSKLERHYLCAEFEGLPTADYKNYKCKLSPLDDKYEYHFTPRKKFRRQFFG